MIHLSFLVEVVVICGVGLSGLGNSSGVGGSTPTSSTDWSSTARASYLLHRGTWGVMVGKERVCLLPQLWTCFHSLLPMKPSDSYTEYRNQTLHIKFNFEISLVTTSSSPQSSSSPIASLRHLLLGCPGCPSPTHSWGAPAVPLFPMSYASEPLRDEPGPAQGGQGSFLSKQPGGPTHTVVTKPSSPVPGTQRQHAPTVKGKERCGGRPPSQRHARPAWKHIYLPADES